MKQSSIEWLFEHYLPLKKGLELNQPLVVELYKKAKEMHKQEVIKASIEFMNTDGIPNEKELAEQYFNDKFKTESNGTT